MGFSGKRVRGIPFFYLYIKAAPKGGTGITGACEENLSALPEKIKNAREEDLTDEPR